MAGLRSRRARFALVCGLVAAAIAGATAYSLLAPGRYVATAELLVTPVADDTYEGLPVVRASPDADRATAAIASAITAGTVADAVKIRLGLPSREAAVEAVEVDVDEDARLVRVGGEDDDDPQRAAQIANAFVDELVARRSERFQRAIAAQLARLRERLSQIPAAPRDDPPAAALRARVTELQLLEGAPDPSVEVVGDAVAPTESERPRGSVIVPTAAAAALLAGLLISTLIRNGRRTQPSPPPASEDGASAAMLDRLERRVEQLEAAAAVPAAVEPPVEAQPEPEPEPMVATPPAREPPPPPAAEPAAGPATGAYNVEELERLVAEAADAFPHRVDEWRQYVLLLRDYAGPDGRLPSSFDYLVDETFGELLAGRR